jgi:hypothetical protein
MKRGLLLPWPLGAALTLVLVWSTATSAALASGPAGRLPVIAQPSPAIALDPSTWTPIGPAPNTKGFTDYDEDASGRISGIAAHPTNRDIVYVAAAGGGVWRTTDRGVSWTPLTDAQSTLFMGAIALAPSSPNVIYAGTGEASMGPSKARNFRDNIYYGRGILKSTDSGTTWTLLGNAEFDRRTISRIVVDPIDPLIVYVAVGSTATNGVDGGRGIWKSTDGGTTWTNTTRAISETAAFSDLVMDPSDPQVLYAAAGEPWGDAANGVYKTINAGLDWSVAGDFPTGLSDQGLGRISLAISRASPGTVYAAVAGCADGISCIPPPGRPLTGLHKLMRSADAGTTWLELPRPSLSAAGCPSGGSLLNYLAAAGDYHNTLAADPVDSNVVYAGGICLIKSVDGGSTATNWSAIAPGDTTGPHRDHHALVFDADGKLLNGNDGGIWRLEGGATPWQNMNGGNLQITQFIGLALHPTDPNIVYGGTQDTGTVRFEGNVRWPRLLRGDGGASALGATTPNSLYQVTRLSSSSASIFRRWDDVAKTWSIRVNGIDATDPKNFYPPMAQDPGNADRLLLGTNRVYETLNGGGMWNAISTPGASGWTVADRIDCLAVAPSDARTVYASAGGHLFATTDGGTGWRQTDILGAADHFQGLLVDPANAAIAYAVRDRFGGGHVYRTVDAGLTWADISGDLPDLPVHAIAIDPRRVPNTLFVGNDSGVYSSTNLGISWTRLGAGLPNAQVTVLKLNTTLNILAAATHGRGVWELLVP